KRSAAHSHGRMAVMAAKAQGSAARMRVQPEMNVAARTPAEIGEPHVALSTLFKARRERQRALIVPREHGAWGLLLVPMATGAGVAFHQASHVFPLILLLTAALALFWLRTPLESFLGTSAMRAQTLEESHTLRSAIVR